VDITQDTRDVTEVMLQSEIEQGSVRLRYVLEDEIEDIRSSYESALIRVEDSIPDVNVFADEMLESVFRNLLNNAIQHNNKDVPEVTVSATRTETTVSIRIADNGPGVANSQKNTIFRQGEKGLESEGTGLGLYLVDTLVDRYDGDVHIEDNEPEGAVFIVEIPVVE
jgi:signal transduction histidine kinase